MRIPVNVRIFPVNVAVRTKKVIASVKNPKYRIFAYAVPNAHPATTIVKKETSVHPSIVGIVHVNVYVVPIAHPMTMIVKMDRKDRRMIAGLAHVTYARVLK